MTKKTEILRKQQDEGRSILQMKPIDRTAYVAWSDASREAVAGAFGAGSREHKELFGARREISVRFDSDPSYYLTQLAANLRRELTVLRKCLDALGGGGPRDEPSLGSPAGTGAPPPPAAEPAAAMPQAAARLQAAASPRAPAARSAAHPGDPKAPAGSMDRAAKKTAAADLRALLEKLREAEIRHQIRDDRAGAVSIDIAVPGERWEIDLLADGTVEIEVFKSDGSIHGEAKLEELLRRFSG